MNTPILSIIIPVFNVENYTRECLDSLLQQDLSACEVLCVNDGSTDGSLAILQEYQASHPNVFRVFSQINQGQAAARNKALDEAKGEFVVFLDSDDYYLPNAIATIMSNIKTYPHVDVFYWDCAVTTEGNRYYTLPHVSPVEQQIIEYYDWEYDQYTTTPTGCVWGGGYRKTFLDMNHLRMRPGVYYEDELFIYSIFTCQGNVLALHLNQPFYYYRTGRDGSTVTSLREKNFKDRMTVTREMNKILQQSQCITEARKHKIFSMYLQNIIEGYQYGFIASITKMLTKEDLVIMSVGAMSQHEKKLLRLLKISPRLMAAYKTNQLPSFIRRFINVFVK
jgi:glycosyltransferase involved in cell wall biosynthesis